VKWLQNLLGGRGRKAAPAPVATMRKEAGNIYVLQVGGVINKATVDRIQAIAAQAVERDAKDLKLLLILSGFEGWRKGDDWGDLDFFARYGDDISRIAVVGEARWEDPMRIFLLAGRRRADVRFFTPDQAVQARAWLAGA